MIIVRLSGGLGNQMFQYAAAKRLAAMHGAILKLDTTRLLKTAPVDTPREYALGCFNISAAFASVVEGVLCDKLGNRHSSPLFQILVGFGLHRTETGLRYVRQQGTAFDRSILDLPDNVCLEGFWQSEKYFPGIRDILHKEFTLRNALEGEDLKLAERIQACNAVSLHVRRGDYLSNPHAARHHGTCGGDYYGRAVRYIGEKVPSPHLFIFSDDPAWTRANLKYDLPTTFVSSIDQTDDGRDLTLMSMCRHHIIANSSFSWWGAWLGEYPGKTVIAPLRWFADPARDASDIIPEGWISF
jgi:hypothetical protein